MESGLLINLIGYRYKSKNNKEIAFMGEILHLVVIFKSQMLHFNYSYFVVLF